MDWNWKQKNWPKFEYNASALAEIEAHFQRQSGSLFGAMKYIDDINRSDLVITVMSTEALKTSEIEGELLKRESVRASLQKNFGLQKDGTKILPAEEGICEMMVSVHREYAALLSHETLFQWHEMITRGRRDLKDQGCYRTHEGEMQIISGAAYAPKIHFEAPPSNTLLFEMTRFIEWFNGSLSLPALTRASMAHFYFESIHPFEDGNGRIGRALVIKALSQSVKAPVLMALSHAIEKNKKEYYRHLELFNRRLEITGWIQYFADTIIEAQSYAVTLIDFLIAKTRLFDRLKGSLNARQEKALSRMFREGPEGFKGGMSAENYIKITGATRPTATRDLADMVAKRALTKTGQRRHTRYHIFVQL